MMTMEGLSWDGELRGEIKSRLGLSARELGIKETTA